MQQGDSDTLHRSTLWRRRTGRMVGSGNGRRTTEQNAEALALAAGIIDSIRRMDIATLGSCPKCPVFILNMWATRSRL